MSQPSTPPRGNPSLIEATLSRVSAWQTPKVVLHEVVAQLAQTRPDVAAVVAGTRRLTYRELDAAANTLANVLIARGVRRGTRVGVCVGRNETVVVALLAVFKAGGVYVPLAVDGAVERFQLICRDAQLGMVLTDGVGGERAKDAGVPITLVETDALLAHPIAAPGLQVLPEDLAYMIYTSGSTGQPKGVLTRHIALTNQIFGWEDFTPAFADLSGTLIAPFVFDNSLWEHFFVLAWGGTLHVLSDEVRKDPQSLTEYLIEHRITSTNIPPVLLASVAREFEARPGSFPLRRLVAGAESVSQATFQRFRDLSPELELIVGYGPTEAAITATVHRFDRITDPAQPVPIGKPLPGYRIYVLGETLELLPRGEAGQIAIGGTNVLADGYAAQAELSAQKFVPDPFATDASARMYLTGDLGRALEDGTILFLGRSDDQVKIRGHRVELGEIESSVMQDPSVRSAVVKVVPGPGQEAVLVAYLEGRDIDVASVRERLRKRLPEYMMPRYFELLERFPLTESGKVNRKALPAPSFSEERPKRSSTPPRSALETFVWNAWSEALGTKEFGVDEQFTDLGGHSMLAVKLVAGIQDALGVRVSSRSLLKCSTVGEFATVLEASPDVRQMFSSQQHG